MQTLGRLLLSFIILLCNMALAQTPVETYVPGPLKDWQLWVLEKHREIGCPFDGISIENRHCIWPSHLTL
ncbi:MAG: hypothetical protein AABY86_03605, partial [Bdellovibrionota bacterium]